MHEEDLYRRLGVSHSVDAATLRKAFRRLALRFHPDRAGPGATAHFQGIAAAYATLSDPERRASYDRTFRPNDSQVYRRAEPPTRNVPEQVLPRLSGRLSDLVAQGAARVHSDGTIDLHLTADELQRGGLAGVTLRLPVTCWVCGGLAERHGFDCELCGFEGSLLEAVTVWVPLAPGTRLGDMFSLSFDRLAPSRRLTFRMCCG